MRESESIFERKYFFGSVKIFYNFSPTNSKSEISNSKIPQIRVASGDSDAKHRAQLLVVSYHKHEVARVNRLSFIVSASVSC